MTQSKTHRLVKWALGATVAALLPGCSSVPRPVPASAVLARYVLLATSAEAETIAYARVILDAGQLDCPAIAAGGAAPITMSFRDNPHGFSVRACEALVPFDADLMLETEPPLSLPRATKAPNNILVMGDTGCEPSDCPEGPAQPFAAMAAKAAATPPDLMIHVGDYNYRGTSGQFPQRDPKTGQETQVWAYDAGDGLSVSDNCSQAPDSGFTSQNQSGSERPDAWEYWRDDFFAAAGDLLPSAPWVFARGNHELCSRAGPGWFYFLDPSSNLPSGTGQISCPAPRQDANPILSVVFPAPYRLDLGSLRLIVYDSSNACDSFVTPEMADFTERLHDQAVAIKELTAGEAATWLVTHRPIWGVTEYDSKESVGCTAANAFGCINAALQHSFGQVFPEGLPSSIRLSLAGHMHRFQSLTFPMGNRPPQLVIGLSGVKLDGSPPTGTFQATIQGLAATGAATGSEIRRPEGPVGAFGFLEVQYSESGWSGILRDLQASVDIARCGSERLAAGSICRLSASAAGN